MPSSATPSVARPDAFPPAAPFLAFERLLWEHLARITGVGPLQMREFMPVPFDPGTASPADLALWWQQESFFEGYCRGVDLDLTAFLAKLLRDHPGPALHPALLGSSPATLALPPLSVPLFPISAREGEVTIASWVPGLRALLTRPEAHALNAFWGVSRLGCVWCEPAHLRETLRPLEPRLLVRRPLQAVLGSDNAGLPWVDLNGVSPGEKTNQWFSPLLQRRYNAAPLHLGKRFLTLGVPRTLDGRVRAEIEGALRHRFTIQQVLVDAEALARFVSASESRAINTTGLVQSMLNVERTGRHAENLEVIEADRLHHAAPRGTDDEGAVVKFVHSIIYKAVDMGASDIMFQEFPAKLRVRYKLDGDWFDETGEFPGHVARQVISRLKVISGLEIQYVRLPQDGTFPIRIGDRRYDFRVNTSHQAQGEQAVLRLQRDQRHVRTLAELGLPEAHARAVDAVMNGDHGLLILCGPTGSGKSTTIYSILRGLDAVRNNVLTAESPIEIHLDNVSQTQVDEHGPYTYAAWARGILRQAPDVVMMGEIRDEESVDALMRLSSSGHRAISTLHTNSACEVPSRFFLFRAQPFMVADSLKLAISQRLVKKVCPRCYVDVPVPGRDRLRALGINPAWLGDAPGFRRGRGCELCRQSGVSGRKAVFEALVVDDEIRTAIQDRAPSDRFRRLMEARGEATLFESAVREAALGVIPLEEACKFREWAAEGA